MDFLAIAFFLYSLPNPWQLILCIISFLTGFQGQTTTDTAIINRISKSIITSTFLENESPRGLFFIKWGFGFMALETPKETTGKLYLFCSREQYETFKKAPKEEKQEEDDPEQIEGKIKAYKITGREYWSIDAVLDWIKKKNYSPTPEQQSVIDKIIKVYDRKQNAIVFLHGNSGSGKSKIGKLLAKHFRSSYCDKLNLLKPGHFFDTLVAKVNPTKKKPLILVFNEVDKKLKRINEEKVQEHKFMNLEITEKDEWNTFLDDFEDYESKENVILIMTSNTSYSDLNKIDSSFLRDYRTDLIVEMNKIIKKNEKGEIITENATKSNDIIININF